MANPPQPKPVDDKRCGNMSKKDRKDRKGDKEEMTTRSEKKSKEKKTGSPQVQSSLNFCQRDKQMLKVLEEIGMMLKTLAG